MACFDDYIGIRTICTADTPDFDLFIEDIPGISVRAAHDAANAEYASGIDLLRKKITLGWQLAATDIQMRMAPRLRAMSVVKQDTVGRYEKTRQAVSSESGFYGGIATEIIDGNLAFDIEKITVWIDTTQVEEVKVFDLISGLELDSFNVSAVAGVPVSLAINKRYNTEDNRFQLAVVRDLGTAGTFQTQLDHNCLTCTNGIHRIIRHNNLQFQASKILKTDTKIWNNLKSIGNTGGISFTYSVNCDYENWICSIGRPAMFVAWYRIGIEIVKEMISNKVRLNSIITLHRGNNQELLDQLSEDYERQLSNLVNNMNLPHDSICFKCNNNVHSMLGI